MIDESPAAERTGGRSVHVPLLYANTEAYGYSNPTSPTPSIAHRVVNDEPDSVEVYQSFARQQEEHFEYVDGWIISMAAA